jgi:hypothetical protein
MPCKILGFHHGVVEAEAFAILVYWCLVTDVSGQPVGSHLQESTCAAEYSRRTEALKTPYLEITSVCDIVSMTKALVGFSCHSLRESFTKIHRESVSLVRICALAVVFA